MECENIVAKALHSILDAYSYSIYPNSTEIDVYIEGDDTFHASVWCHHDDDGLEKFLNKNAICTQSDLQQYKSITFNYTVFDIENILEYLKTRVLYPEELLFAYDNKLFDNAYILMKFELGCFYKRKLKYIDKKKIKKLPRTNIFSKLSYDEKRSVLKDAFKIYEVFTDNIGDYYDILDEINNMQRNIYFGFRISHLQDPKSDYGLDLFVSTKYCKNMTITKNFISIPSNIFFENSLAPYIREQFLKYHLDLPTENEPSWSLH